MGARGKGSRKRFFGREGGRDNRVEHDGGKRDGGKQDGGQIDTSPVV